MAEAVANIAVMFFVSKGIEETAKGTVSAFKGKGKEETPVGTGPDSPEAEKLKQETAKEKETSAARRTLFAEPTSGFGPNTNLARSFLTTL